MTCPPCGGAAHRKNGLARGGQRYLCRGCGRNFTGGSGRAYPPERRRQALELSLEGMGLRAIGRFLRVSNGTVLRGVRAAGQRAEQQADAAPAQAVRLAQVDEWHS
jgi:transposase-like protein